MERGSGKNDHKSSDAGQLYDMEIAGIEFELEQNRVTLKIIALEHGYLLPTFHYQQLGKVIAIIA